MQLSTESASNVNKPFLTRYGEGFHCHNCGDSREYSSDPVIKQTPEGLGKHWYHFHLYEHGDHHRFICPARGCNSGEQQRRYQTTTTKEMYTHLLIHTSKTLIATPGQRNGWLLPDDVFPFDINPKHSAQSVEP